MKKITCFINSLAGGGAEHQMVILANALSEYGYHVSFATYNDSDDGQYRLHPNVKHLSIRANGNKIQKWCAIKRFMQQLDTDCIISYRAPVNLILLSSMFLRKKPEIIVSERSLTVGRPNIVEILNLGIFYRRAKYVVPNSVSQYKHILEVRPAFKEKLVTIYNYTELDKYVPTPLPNHEELVIGIFCRYHKQKNYNNFAQALALLKQRELRARFIWFGKAYTNDGTPIACYEDFQSIIEHLGISSMIELHDLVVDVAGQMQLCDAICLPSFYEGFSNSLSEAICCGRPIVASNVSDNPYMVKEGVNGFLFNPSDVIDMADALEKMIRTSTTERNRMANASRKIAEELFNKRQFVNSYVNLIES